MVEWYAKKTFGSLPARMATRFPEREALVFGEQRISFEELEQAVDRVAKGLIGLGVGPGDKVALWLMNQPEWIYLLFAIARIGAVLVPVNTRFRTHDLEYLITQSDSAYLITHDRSGPIDYLAMVREVVELPETGVEVSDTRRPALSRVVVLSEESHPGTVAWKDLLQGANAVDDEASRARTAAVDPDDPVVIMYTSGTTGFPKGVVHNHNMLRLVEERGFRMGITQRDVILNYLPLFHLFGYSEGALMSMLTGAKQILTASFDPDESIRLIEREAVTIVHGFETHMKDLVEAQERLGADVSSLRTGLVAAGMHSATPIMRRAAEVLPNLRSVSGYGMSEMGAGTLLGALDDDLEHRAETSGYPVIGYEVRIVDPETGRDQPAGEPGEILFKGYSLMLGYYNKPEETAACYDSEGWFHTGDTGIWLDDGYIRFLGRYKDMLKVGGENVDPMEVEGLLLQHPEVRQVAVVSLPDARLSEVPVAFVERTPGASVGENEIVEHCRGKVASFKIPRHVVFVDAFPMTASGKIRKIELRETAKQLLSADRGPGDAT